MVCFDGYGDVSKGTVNRVVEKKLTKLSKMAEQKI